MKIAKRVDEVSEVDQYSLVNCLVRFVRIKINFDFGRTLVPSVRISLTECILKKVVWIDLGMNVCHNSIFIVDI